MAFLLALSAFLASLILNAIQTILNAIQTLRGHVLGDWPARRGQRVQRSTHGQGLYLDRLLACPECLLAELASQYNTHATRACTGRLASAPCPARPEV
jgi:hypothetical protein